MWLRCKGLWLVDKVDVMEFLGDLNTLRRPERVRINLNEFTIPDENALFFRAKQKELVEQYRSTRLFLSETDTKDWNHWFGESDNADANEFFKRTMQADFYEAALFFYNSVVDISWMLCYVAAEFVCGCRNTRISIGGMPTLSEAVEKLRGVERNVVTPTAEENPFGYLLRMCSDFSEPINQITKFYSSPLK